ncbi:MAG: methyl-accepting chemotaxis protein, partial [Methanosarcinales archaeon]|nr:methyl-accepting chemotaxis protein [Methanosarcinales archaeon]
MVHKTLSPVERDRLLHRLHGYLAWVGAEIPPVFEVDDMQIQLHELVWRLINKKELTDDEITGIESLICALEKKELCDEAAIAEADITEEEANNLYNEASGLLRAIMDLKDLERGARPDDYDLRRKVAQKKVRDAHSLL